MNKKYVVRVTKDERKQLEELVSKGKTAAYKIKHANILLMVDADGPNETDERTSKAFRCHLNTVCNVRRRFVEQGLEKALERKKRERPPRQPILDGKKQARLIALSCSEPPEGRSRWTLKLLANQLVVLLDVVESISDQTVRRALKKTN